MQKKSRTLISVAKTRLSQKAALIVFGLLLSVLLLEAGLRLAGLALLTVREYGNMLSVRYQGAYRILCIGESTTQNQYPRFLEEALNRQGTGVRFSVIDKGKVGATTSFLLINTPAYIAQYRPNMVITMMGINDVTELQQFNVPSLPRQQEPFVESLRVYKLVHMLGLRVSRNAREPAVSPFPWAQTRPGGEVDLDSVELEPALKNADIAKKELELKKKIELDPDDDDAYVALGWLYHHQGTFMQREECFRKAIQINPSNSQAYAKLGHLYRDMHLPEKAEESFRIALELRPDDYQTHLWMGELFMGRKRYGEAAVYFERAMQLGAQDFKSYLLLGQVYRCTGKLEQAEKCLQKALALYPSSQAQFDISKLYGALSIIYEEMGQDILADECAKLANWQRLREYNRVTVENYQKLKQLLDKEKIKLVCAQYPMRDVEPLKKLFGQDASGIIFVDNQKVFRDAVRRQSYKQYFKDMFGGDFGHCTDDGNRLLAENIASVVYKEVFKK